MMSNLKKYFLFNGRLSREEMLLLFITMYLIREEGSIALDFILKNHVIENKFRIIPFFIFIYPVLASSVRRLHDLNRSGLWAIFPFSILIFEAVNVTLLPNLYLFLNENILYLIIKVIFFSISIAMFFFLLYRRGTFGPNKYGPDPLLPTVLSSDSEKSGRDFSPAAQVRNDTHGETG